MSMLNFTTEVSKTELCSGNVNSIIVRKENIRVLNLHICEKIEKQNLIASLKNLINEIERQL